MGYPDNNLLRGPYNDDDHSQCAFSSDKYCRAHQNQNGHRDGSQCKSELNILPPGNNDHELNRESKEKEEIELEQSDVNLKNNRKLILFSFLCIADNHEPGK